MACWSGTGSSGSMADPWNPAVRSCVGAWEPVGPAVKVAGVWTRPFERGAVTVDARTGTATVG